MKNLRLRLMFFPILVFLFLASGCAVKSVEPIQYVPSQPASQSVVILYHKTPFKAELVSGIAKVLKTRGIRTTTDDLKNANEYPPISTDLVVLVVSVWSGRATGDALHYLDSYKGVSNILVVSTSGRGNLSGLERYHKYKSIEAVTGASSLDSAGAFAEEITIAILHRLSKQQKGQR